MVHRGQQRISVVVPCINAHLHLLPDLLGRLESQSRPPDEVLVSLSGVDTANRFPGGDWSFELHVLSSNRLLGPGTSRQRASGLARGDLIVYQDADDLPHRQRLEIAEYCFRHHDIVHLVHGETLAREDYRKWKSVIGQKRFVLGLHSFGVEYSAADIAELPLYVNDGRYDRLTAGHPAHGKPIISREVLARVSWTDKPTGEDKVFNETVMAAFPGRCWFMDRCLYLYRNTLSSYT